MNIWVWTLTKYAIFSDVNCIYKFNIIDVFNPEYECIDLELLVKNGIVKEKIKDTRSGIKDNESIKNHLLFEKFLKNDQIHNLIFEN